MLGVLLEVSFLEQGVIDPVLSDGIIVKMLFLSVTSDHVKHFYNKSNKIDVSIII